MRNLFRFGYVAALFGVYENRPQVDLRAPYRDRVKTLRMTYEDLDSSVKGRIDRSGLYKLSAELEQRSMAYRITAPSPEDEPAVESRLEADIARLREKVFGAQKREEQG